jgi:hypothetical protein
MATEHGEDERGIGTRAILSRLENLGNRWVGKDGKCVTDAMSTAAGRTGGRTLRLSGKSGQSSLLVVKTTRASAGSRSPAILKHLH